MYILHQKGEIARLKVELKAIEKGWIVSKPSELNRYDLILDDGKKLWRVQVKYSDCEIDGLIRTSFTKNSFNTKEIKKSRKYSKYEIDVIIIYSPKLDKLFWITDFDNKTGISLRYSETKNGQIKNVKYTRDYEWL